jgi:hypothetical protein
MQSSEDSNGEPDDRDARYDFSLLNRVVVEHCRIYKRGSAVDNEGITEPVEGGYESHEVGGLEQTQSQVE